MAEYDVLVCGRGSVGPSLLAEHRDLFRPATGLARILFATTTPKD
jgi:hypothetical protein